MFNFSVSDLDIPAELPEPSRAAIAASGDRLNRAIAASDLSDAIDRSKVLAETVAKVVLDVRGEPIDPKVKMPALVAAAHEAVDRQPGKGLSSDPKLVVIAQSMKTLILTLPPLRNTLGAGHGTARVPEVTDEHGRLVVDATIVWCRWILGRLPAYLLSDIEMLINLLESGTFTGGLLRSRLQSIDFDGTPTADQSRLGNAVGRRAVRQTFLVQGEGVEAAISFPANFPVAYRLGIIHALLFDSDGFLSATEWSVKAAAQLIANGGHPPKTIEALAGHVGTATVTLAPVTSPPSIQSLIATAGSAAQFLSEPDRTVWSSGWETLRSEIERPW